MKKRLLGNNGLEVSEFGLNIGGLAWTAILKESEKWQKLLPSMNRLR
jgi:hypothetical protein